MRPERRLYGALRNAFSRSPIRYSSPAADELASGVMVVRAGCSAGLGSEVWGAGFWGLGASLALSPRHPAPATRSYTPAGLAPAIGAVTTAFSIHLVVTDFGRVIGSPMARAMTACEHTPSARDTANSTV